MNLVAIDTTREHGSIALMTEATILEEVALHAADGFSPVLFGEIQALLARHGVSLHDIDAFAAASGPGSFTGVRVGLTAVKGFAEALGKQAVGVSNLQALASFGTHALRAPFLDARRGEIYGAIYDSQLREVSAEVVTKFSDWAAALPEGAEIISGDFVVPAGFGPVTMAPLSLAAAIGRIALSRLNGAVSLSESVDANYVRRSDAELFWRDSA